MSNNNVPKLKPGILLLPQGPSGEKWGIDDWAAQRDWGPDDFNAFIYPMCEVFDTDTGEFIAEKRGPISSSSSTLVSENDGVNDVKEIAALLPAMSVSEFLEEAPVTYNWLCEGIAAKGAVTKLAGKAKASGKTTLLMCLVADILAGTPFLDRPTKPGRVLVANEQGRNLKQALIDAGLDDPNVEGLHLLPANRVAHMDWKELMRVMRAYCLAHEIDLLIIDTLVDFSDVEDDGENLAGKVKGTIKPVKNLAQQHDIGVIFTQHHNIEGRGRGSTQFEADPDILIDLFAPNQVAGDLEHNHRQLSAKGRGVDYKQLIKFTPEGGYEALNQTDEDLAKVGKKAKTVLRFLPVLEAEARTVTQLEKALKNGITPRWRTVLAYATAISFIVACS